jgi:hypothetical protein
MKTLSGGRLGPNLQSFVKSDKASAVPGGEGKIDDLAGPQRGRTNQD